MSVSLSITRKPIRSIDDLFNDVALHISTLLEIDATPYRNGMLDAYRRQIGAVRREFGYTTDKWALLASGKNNAKLAKNEMRTFSLTLSSHLHEMMDGRRYNMCPNAGTCVATCVGKHGKGELSSVQKARAWRTEALLRHPIAFIAVLRDELKHASRKGTIAVRLNVNSDVPWWQIADVLLGDLDVRAYDYTKDVRILEMFTPYVTENYRLCFSYSEKIARDPALQRKLAGWRGMGGSIAVVTDRRKGQEPMRYMDLDEFNECVPVISGDEDDDRYLDPCGVIVDLRMKGYAIKRMPPIVQRVYADKN